MWADSSPILLRKALLSYSRERMVVMTIMVLVPNWGADAEMRSYAEALAKGWSYVPSPFGYDYEVNFSGIHGCHVIKINGRPDSMPDPLREVPLCSIEIIKHNSPVSWAIDGRYEDGNITARVETYIKDGLFQQTIRVTGTSGVTVEELNLWFDSLLAGDKGDKNVEPITYPEQPQPQLVLEPQ